MSQDQLSVIFPTGSLIMSAYMVGMHIPLVWLSEERQNRTLEVLLLTPVRPMEIIAA